MLFQRASVLRWLKHQRICGGERFDRYRIGDGGGVFGEGVALRQPPKPALVSRSYCRLPG